MIQPFILNDFYRRRLAAVFVLMLFVFEVYVVGVNYSQYFVYLLEFETVFFSVVASAAILASFYLAYRFVSLAIASSPALKIFCLVIFTISLFIEYGYQKALGRFSDTADIKTAFIATSEQQVASIMMYLNLTAIVPCVVFCLILFCFRTMERFRIKSFLAINLMLILAFASFPFIVDQKFPTLATNAFYRTSTDFLMNGSTMGPGWITGATAGTKRRRHIPQPMLPADYRPQNNIVIVIDESIRGDHLSLNGYARITTPFLDKLALEKRLFNWGLASAASTGSRFTYAALITGLGPDDFPDKTEFKISTFPTIFQFAKAMRYSTHFFDGQMNGYWGGVEDDKTYIDSWQGVHDITEGMAVPRDIDTIIAKKVNRIVSASTGNLIFVFKRGAHIPYDSNFPKEKEIWAPSYAAVNKFDIPSGAHLPQVVNAYDNSIRYNTDAFFQHLIDDYSNIPNNSVIIYTGDHGQTLFVNGRSSHGGNTKEEATVPLFIIGRLRSSVDTRYKASHQNIFPTVLDLLGYPTENRDHPTVPSLLSAKAADTKQRYFNPDLGHKVPFD